MNTKVKTILIILIVILISAISFGGIYVRKLNTYTNVISDYMLARNLKGSRVVELKVVEEAVEEKETTEGETVEEEINDEQVVKSTKISKENLNVVKKILEERLKKLGSEDYVIEQNSETGDTTIYLNEDELTDNITGYLTSMGNFKIVDAENEENVLMTNEHLNDVKVGYAPDTSGTTVYLSIEFNKEGKQKFEEITNIYTTLEKEETVNNVQNEVTSEEIANGEDDTKDDTTTKKQVKLMLDDTEIMTTSFEEPISNGILQMSIGSSSSNVADLQTYLTQANGIAVLLNSGEMPIEYTMEKNEYVSIDMTQNIQIAIMVLAGIILIACIVLIIKYKAKGLKVTVSFIGMIAIFLLLVRYTNVYVAMESSIAFIILIIVNIYLNCLILKNNKENKILISILNAYKKSAKITIPVLVIAIVLCFIHWIPIASIGMLLFWGLISTLITNFTITLPILNNEK